MRLLVPFLLALAFAACGYGGASPRPSVGDLSAVLGALALRGATVHDQVSGDAGCASSELHSNAVRLSLSLAGDATVHDVYLFRWRRPADFAAAAASFDACLAAHAAGNADADVESLEVPPWRAYGVAWPPAVRSAVDGALRAVGGG